MKLQRYEIGFKDELGMYPEPTMEASDGGEYVRAEDVEKLEAENARLRKSFDAQRDFFAAWLLRCLNGMQRQGWGEGWSADETLDHLRDVLANMECDPAIPSHLLEVERLIELPLKHCPPALGAP